MRELLESNNPDPDIDLEAEFDDLNKTLFDGQLKPIPIEWFNSKRVSGQFQGTRIKQGRRIIEERADRILISKYFVQTRDKIRAILAHEMIHYWILDQGIRDTGPHGVFFREKLGELNDKGILEIPEEDILTDEKVRNSKPLKSPLVVIKKTSSENDNTFMALLDKGKAWGKLARDEIVEMFRHHSQYGNKKYTLTISETNHPEMARYPKQVKYTRPYKVKFIGPVPEDDTWLGDVIETVEIDSGKIKK